MVNRRTVPFDIGPVHLVGIGGIGMSGIAEVMLNLGYQVQGSDLRENANTERLRTKGATIFIGHAAENLGRAGAVVISSAVKPGNPELDAARERSIPVVRRAEMLAELMRLNWTVAVGGTHGKTTTTSMVAALLESAKLDPTVINGGVINDYGSNARVGDGEWMVVEADESDGTFTKLFATAAIVTNMDPEHLDHYGNVDSMKAGFEAFVNNVPFYGFAVLCLDHHEVQAMVSRIRDRRIITYGFNPQADVRAINVRAEPNGSRYDVELRPRKGEPETLIRDLFLPMPGKHNVQNSLAAITVAWEIGAGVEAIRKGLKKFGGVRRRFSAAGEWNGVRIIDDYGHHPVEISAVLSAARDVTQGKVIAVVQPHRYTRLRDLFQEFAQCFYDADAVLVADVYPAGESPIDGVSADSLVEAIKRSGHKRVAKLGAWDELPLIVADEAKDGDLVVCLGAGDITSYANGLAEKLKALPVE
ncbi:MAG: UDP-N-acetylmuramate--L-alanine ligase [Caulobacterales bacterium]